MDSTRKIALAFMAILVGGITFLLVKLFMSL
jgi:hypothetical protein